MFFKRIIIENAFLITKITGNTLNNLIVFSIQCKNEEFEGAYFDYAE